MIKKTILLVTLFALLPAIALADFNIAKWQKYKQVEDVQTGLNRFAIDDELFAGTRSDLRDLRLIDSSNKEVPYKLLMSKSRNERRKFSPKVLNNSYNESGDTSLILDFGENNQGVSNLLINTPNQNFQRSVEVYGSESAKENWNLLTDKAYIYDYTDKRGGLATQKTEISFTNSIFRYLMVVVKSDGGERFVVNSVNAYDYISERSKEYVRQPVFKQKRDRVKKTSDIFVDLEVSGIPTRKIELAVADSNFRRGVEIYSSYDNNKWHLVGSDYIFRYNTDKFRGENLSLNFSETDERYLKIVIYNNDNEELDITNLKSFSLYREVVFEADSSKNYRVYYANREARFPVYDIDNYFAYFDLDKVKDVSLGSEMENTAFVLPARNSSKEPASEVVPYLMSVGLLAAAIMLLFLVYNFFQKK